MPLGVEELRTQAIVPDAVARYDGGDVHLPFDLEFAIAGLEPARERFESAVNRGDAEVTNAEAERLVPGEPEDPRLYGEWVSERHSAANAAMALPDRVTVLTCIGCGAMGREERCDGDCSEHKLVLVSAVDHDELLRAADAARVRAARLASAVRPFVDVHARSGDPRDTLLELRDGARRALRDGGRVEPRTDWASPATVTGWWCAQCGNVDMPQPCLGVCVWRPADWVSLALYERRLRLAEPDLRAARSLSGFLARAAAVTPRAGEGQRNLDAFRAQARAALEDLR